MRGGCDVSEYFSMKQYEMFRRLLVFHSVTPISRNVTSHSQNHCSVTKESLFNPHGETQQCDCATHKTKNGSFQ